MKLDYKILWLDDKISEFRDDEYVQEIKEYLQSEEFNPIIHETNDQSEFFKYLQKNTYDLILTDFHLNENRNNKNINGDNIVEMVRQKNIFTEIFFYTAKAELKGKLKWDRISFLETEQFGKAQHHEKVVEKIINLINLTIEKFHDIVIMRGMIMNETSDLDNQKIRLIQMFIEKSEPKTITDLKLDILKEIDENFSSKLKKVNGDWKEKDSGFKNLIKDNFVFSSAYKIKTLGWILNQISEEDFSSSYDDEIINIRNLFAHVTLQEDKDEDGNVIRKYFKKDGDDYDSAFCKKIRGNIKKHKNNLNNLEQKLK